MLQRILLAVDGSEPSNRAAELAGELAQATHGEVLVLHVAERATTLAGAVPLESESEAHEVVDRAVRLLKDQGVSARGEVRTGIYGRAPRIVLEEAETYDANVVVMGSRGLSDLAGLVLGSVAHKVLHLSRCPVMVVR